MAKSLKVFYSVAVAVCLVFLAFSFSACGKTYTYEDLQKQYNALLKEFDNNLFVKDDVSGEYSFKITYSERIQTFIDEAQASDQLKKFSSNYLETKAIFEPVLRVCFESVNYYINSQTKTPKVSSGAVENVCNKLTNLRESLKTINKDKLIMEEIEKHIISDVEAKQRVNSLLRNYRKDFEIAISSANTFALSFLDFYEKEVLTDYPVEGRISPVKTTFEIVRLMQMNAYMFEKTEIAIFRDATLPVLFTNFCNSTLSRFLNVKSILKETFYLIQVDPKTEFEEKMIDVFNSLKAYEIYFDNELKHFELVIQKYSIKDLKEEFDEGTQSFDQQICYEQVIETINDLQLVDEYANNLITLIEDWNGSRT